MTIVEQPAPHRARVARGASVIAIVGVAGACLGMLVAAGGGPIHVVRVASFVGMVGAVAAGVAAVASSRPGLRAVLAISATVVLIASSTTFGMTYS